MLRLSRAGGFHERQEFFPFVGFGQAQLLWLNAEPLDFTSGVVPLPAAQVENPPQSAERVVEILVVHLLGKLLRPGLAIADGDLAGPGVVETGPAFKQRLDAIPAVSF